MQSEIQPTVPDLFWEQMSPLLDEALAALGEKDRQAVLPRFFETKSLAEVGNMLGMGEDTARKRVSRALGKLHCYFSKRGISSTTAIITGAISANSVQAAPVAIEKSLTAVALAKGAAASTSTLTLVKGALKLKALRNLTCKRIQCDEIWSFVGCKEKNATPEHKAKGHGDVWTWTAIGHSKAAEQRTKVAHSVSCGFLIPNPQAPAGATENRQTEISFAPSGA